MSVICYIFQIFCNREKQVIVLFAKFVFLWNKPHEVRSSADKNAMLLLIQSIIIEMEQEQQNCTSAVHNVETVLLMPLWAKAQIIYTKSNADQPDAARFPKFCHPSE